MEILYLSLKAKWYNMIKQHIKPEEYRRMTPYWTKRLYDCPANMDWCKTNEPVCSRCSCLCRLKAKPYKYVSLSLGYPKANDFTRRMLIKTSGITYGQGNTDWGAPANEPVYIIKLDTIQATK